MTAGELGTLGCLAGGAAALALGAPVSVGGAFLAGGAAWVAVASARPELGLFGRSTIKVRQGIALTIDDGPDPTTTPALLEALAAHGAHATFFFLADRAGRHPELVRAAAAAGHEIGLHGLTHSACLTWMAPEEGGGWLRAGVAALREAGAPPIRWFRPPFGVVSPRLFASAKEAKLDVAWVSLRSGDGVRVRSDVLQARLARAREGEVVLVHDGSVVTVEVLPSALRSWSPTRVGTLSELEG
ncbi:polysaccharide deacetylase familiy protein [Deltaproteobacteria bacterium]|nr:polysaccharide deacetylase familiy protein [Deltaproteobacteria bacterium]